MARKPRTVSAAASKPVAAPAAPAIQAVVEKGSLCTVPNGYVLYQASNPCRPGSMRHARWDLLLEHAGKPDGKKALAAALAETTLKTNVQGAMRFLRLTKVGASS